MSRKNRILKTLRRKAENETVGLPARRIVGHEIKCANGTVVLCAANDPKSTRGLYRALKKVWKASVTAYAQARRDGA